MLPSFVFFSPSKVIDYSVFYFNGNMEGHVNIYLHHGGRWHMDHVLSYVRGHVHIIEDFMWIFYPLSMLKMSKN